MTTTTRHDRETARRHGRWLRARRADGGMALKAGLVLPLAAGLLLVGQAWLLAGIVDAVAVRGAMLADLDARIAGLAGLILARAMLSALGERAAARGEADRVASATFFTGQPKLISMMAAPR